MDNHTGGCMKGMEGTRMQVGIQDAICRAGVSADLRAWAAREGVDAGPVVTQSDDYNHDIV